MNVTRASYVAEWATKTGKPTREIYVPRALQPDVCFQCGWIREAYLDNGIDGPGNHRNCSRGKW